MDLLGANLLENYRRASTGGEGWMLASIEEYMLPSFEPNLTLLDCTVTVFAFDANKALP